MANVLRFREILVPNSGALMQSDPFLFYPDEVGTIVDTYAQAKRGKFNSRKTFYLDDPQQTTRCHFHPPDDDAQMWSLDITKPKGDRPTLPNPVIQAVRNRKPVWMYPGADEVWDLSKAI
jgi:hypothetical protein